MAVTWDIVNDIFLDWKFIFLTVITHAKNNN